MSYGCGAANAAERFLGLHSLGALLTFVLLPLQLLGSIAPASMPNGFKHPSGSLFRLFGDVPGHCVDVGMPLDGIARAPLPSAVLSTH